MLGGEGGEDYRPRAIEAYREIVFRLLSVRSMPE